MASVRRTKSGVIEIRFFVGEYRRSFYPGRKATKKDADSIGAKLDRLAFCVAQSEAPPPRISEWLATLPDRQHGRLAEWGLVTPRHADRTASMTLDDWLKSYIMRGRRKESTVKQLESAARNLRSYFGTEKPIASFTAADAEDFRIWLETEGRERKKDDDENEKSQGLAKNTVRRRIGRAREFFNLAVRRGIIDSNPFANEVVAVTANAERQFFVPGDWIERCIRQTDCEDWKIMLAFARYAGMRSHETRIQRWEDIDIPNRQMVVRSNKTPPERVCPIFPELLTHLVRAREMADPGAELVVNRYPADANPATTLKKLIDRAGLTVWPKPMQNMRATRETELIAQYPIKDVASWLGNSAPVAMKHYAMTMKESFNRAIEEGAGGIKRVPQNPPHKLATSGNQQQSSNDDNDRESAELLPSSADDRHVLSSGMPRAGLEPA